MKLKQNVIGGLIGAVVLNMVHETLRKLMSDAPQIQLLGEQTLKKSMHAMHLTPPTGKPLYLSTLAGDIISNSLYFSLIGKSGKDNLWLDGLKYGITAGAGAVFLSRPLGLNDAPVNRTPKTSAMTVDYYTLGGLVAAAIISQLRKRKALS